MVAVQVCGGKSFGGKDGAGWLAIFCGLSWLSFLLANTSDLCMLCINEGSGVITDDPDGERFLMTKATRLNPFSMSSNF